MKLGYTMEEASQQVAQLANVLAKAFKEPRKPSPKNVYYVKKDKIYKLTKINNELIYIEQKEYND